MNNGGLSGVSGICLIVLLLMASWTDLRTRRIHNRLTYSMLLAAFGLNGLGTLLSSAGAGQPLLSLLGGIGLWSCFCGTAVCFVVMFLQFLFLGTGAGDVKLMAAVGGFGGMVFGLEVWLVATVAAGVFAVSMLLYRSGWLFVFSWLTAQMSDGYRNQGSDGERGLLSGRLPLAPFFLLGGIVAAGLPAVADVSVMELVFPGLVEG